MGSIDQISLNKIGLICRQAQEVLYRKTNQQSQVNQTQLYWVLRDFALQLKNKEGIKMSPDQYLQQSLKDHEDNLKLDRKLIKKYFVARRCYPLVRPCISQQSLQNLKEVPKTQLRPQFLIESMKIKTSILESIKTKKVQGKDINGSQFVDLIRYFVEYLNQDGLRTNLTLSWDNILENKREEILYQIEEDFSQSIKNYESIMPLSEKEIKKAVKKINSLKDKTIQDLSDHHLTCRQFMKRLQDSEKKYIQQLKQKNNGIIKQNCQKFLIEQLIEVESLSNIQDVPFFLEEGQKKLERGKKMYENHFIEFSKSTVNCTFSKYLQKVFKYFVAETKRLWKFHESLKESQIRGLINQKGSLMVKLQQVQELKLKYEDQLQSLRPKYEESVSLNQHFEGIIERMGKLNGSLQQQLRLEQRELKDVKEEWSKHKIEYQQENQLLNVKIIERCKQIEQLVICKNLQENKIDTLENALFTNSKQHTNSTNRIKKQHQQLLISQKEQFQAILFEKNVRQMQLFQQIEQARINNQGLSQEIQKLKLDKIEYYHKQAEERVLERHRFQTMIRQLNFQVSQSDKKILSLQKKIQILTVSLKEQKKNFKSMQQREIDLAKDKQTKQKSLKQQILKKQLQINSLKQRNLQIEKKIQLLQLEIIQQKSLSKTQAQDMRKKLEEGLAKFSASSQQKYELTKKQYELQQEKISNKLIEAAERIEKLGQIQKALNLKVRQQEQEIVLLKGEVEKQKFWGNKNNSVLEEKVLEVEKIQEQVFRNNSKLKQVINLQKKQIQKWENKYQELKKEKKLEQQPIEENSGQNWRNYPKNIKTEIVQKQHLREREKQQIAKKPRQTSILIKDNHQSMGKKVEIKIKQRVTNILKSSPSKQQKQAENKIEAYEKQILNLQQSNQILLKQNRQLKKNIQSSNKKIPKFSFKQVNLHTFYKQLLNSKSKDQITHENCHQISIENQQIHHRELTQLIQELNKLNQLLIEKDAFILRLQKELQEKQLQLQYLRKEKSVFILDLQEKLVQLECVKSRLQKEIVKMGKQINQHEWEKRVWKARIVQLQMGPKSKEDKSKFYGSKIDLMFNSL